MIETERDWNDRHAPLTELDVWHGELPTRPRQHVEVCELHGTWRPLHIADGDCPACLDEQQQRRLLDPYRRTL